MADDTVDKVVNAQAWSEFCDLLKKAGDVILREDLETDAFERGEGLRYLTRLLRAGFGSFMENTGPRHPYFRAMADRVKMGLDNPDNYYLGASINGRYSYRIRGTRGTIHYLSFAAQNQNFAATDKLTGGAGHLNDSELEVGPDGRFEIIASARKQPGNWLEMNADTSQILVRQTFLDKSSETPVELEIECIEADEPVPPLDPSRVPGQLLGSAMYAMGCAQWFANWVVDFKNHAPVNHFHFPDAENHRLVGGDPNIRLWLGLWDLSPDEALVIEVMPPKCAYWNFQLGNVWAESLDYEFERVHLNSGGATLRDDGSVRIVVAGRDPGVDNWVTTAGHRKGTMGVRWVLADSHPEPICRVVKIEELS